MKKCLIVILAMIHLLVLFGCNGKPVHDNESATIDAESTVTTPSPSDTDNTPADNSGTDTTRACTHTWRRWTEKAAATCTEFGSEERVCIHCHKTERRAIAKTEHKESDWIVEKVAEIGKAGRKYTKCVLCGKRINEKAIPAISESHQHATAEWVTVAYATCTAKGAQNAICSCGKTVASKEISAKGHTVVVDKGVAATCTLSGLSDGSHCSVCNSIIVEQKTLNAKGHTMTSKEVAATATKEAHTLHYCTICSYRYEEFPTSTSPIKFKSNNDGTCSITGLNDKTISNLVIPSKSPSNDTVISIGNEAFKGCTSIVSVVIPDSVTAIGSSAFRSCSNLKSVIFPKSEGNNFKLNYQSFAFSGIEDVDLSKTTMDSVARDAFYGCKKLKTVKLNHVKTIENFAFSQCIELTSLIHSGELTKIGERSFEGCKKLTVLKGKDSQHNLDTVLQFDYHAFYGSAIQDIVFNKNLIATNSAFEGCLNLGTVDFSQVSSNFASFSRSKIEKLIFPSSLTRISSYCFSNANIGPIVLPDSVTEIGNGAFLGANINKITFGSGLKSIRAEAFKDATATYDFSKVNQALTIEYEAFANNTFTSFVFPKSTISIGQAALMGCDNLETLSIPFIAENTKSSSVSTDCFAWLFGNSVDCWEQDTVVPRSLKTVIIHGENPSTRDFMGVKITNLVIGNNITSIGPENFGSDSSLKRIYYEGTEQEWNKINLNTSTNQKLLTAERYYYSDTKPAVTGKYWHYNVNGLIEIW